MLAGWAIYGHMPDDWSLTGICLIALSGAASAWLTVRETCITIKIIATNSLLARTFGHFGLKSPSAI
jgi:hypothetical protein